MAPMRLTREQLIAARARGLLLGQTRASSLDDALAAVGAVQAQSTPAVHQALRVRTTGLRQSEVLHAVTQEHSLVRTTLMRGTLFLVTARDLRWMVALVGPVVRDRDRRRRTQLGISDFDGDRALAALPAVLEGRGAVPLSTLIAELREAVSIDLEGQAPAHLMLLAASHGLVCRGPEAGREPTYALVDEWIAPADLIDRETSMVRLATMDLAARGPATAADFITWSGLPAVACRQAFADLADVTRVHCDGTEFLALAGTDLSPSSPLPARLIGMFDEYLLSHRSRDAILEPVDAPRILTGGMIQSAVLVDGRIAGTWRVTPRKAVVEVELFRPQPARVRHQIDAEVDDILRFLGS